MTEPEPERLPLSSRCAEIERTRRVSEKGSRAGLALAGGSPACGATGRGNVCAKESEINCAPLGIGRHDLSLRLLRCRGCSRMQTSIRHERPQRRVWNCAFPLLNKQVFPISGRTLIISN
ncbi:hypothetical protein NDU88_011807 [Pleurodeles waltl]|uniref:Uncharacterized protein n=1 Tax=Pleurodeles waltl TaxID=8319 RepID=A0AAV7QYC6_PLEWA|nr:hypothetical protein NDU88_011807 [Pleurodeles waltl]